MPEIGVRKNVPDIRAQFIDGMSRAATSVSVVTTDGPAGRFGVTVSAMSSISADGEHPTALICVHHQSRSAAAIIENGTFCINVLRDDQSSIANCFADRIRRADGDKFGCARGYSLLPAKSADVLAQDVLALAAIPLSKPVVPCRLVLGSRTGDVECNPLAQTFRDICRSYFA
jgi:flavin reductase